MVSQLLVVMIAAIAVAIVAERRGFQPPLLLALVGLAASFIPGLPRLELEPDIILTVVLPPLLFSAAQDFSLVSFLKRLGSIVNLGIFLVAVTTGVVGAISFWIVPELTVGAALVLGAVVSPPDAVTAVAVGRKLNLPARMMTVLTGESLINDAAALTLFTFAAASVTGTKLFIPNLLLYLAYSAIVGVIIGAVIGAVVHRVRVRINSASLATVLSILVPFTAFILAEEASASGVLAVVAAGFSLGHNSSEASFASRIQERQFWKTADALLEAFVFAYIGLQLRFVLQDVEERGLALPELLGASLVVLLVVILVRLAWVFVTARLLRWRNKVARERIAQGRPERPRRQRRHPSRRDGREPRLEIHPEFDWRENLVISWTGMRGVVTLAAAAGVPLTTATREPFPGRDLIQAVAFVVTIGTLLVQGLTLPWMIKRLGIADRDDEQEREAQVRFAEKVARQASMQAVTAFRDRQTDERARRVADGMLQRMQAEKALQAPAVAEKRETLMIDMAKEILAARRAAVIKARDDRQLDDEVMRDVLEQMDLEQAVMANWQPGRLGPG